MTTEHQLAKRELFYKTIRQWWDTAAMQGYDFSDTPNTDALENHLWNMKELFERNKCTMADVRKVFDLWVKAHKRRSN